MSSINVKYDYELLYHSSPDMFVSVSAEDAKIINCNETVLKNTGYTRKEIIGQQIFFMYHPDCLNEVKKAFKSYQERGKITNLELCLKKKNGSKIPVLLDVNSIKDENGNVLYSNSCWRDISKLKKVETQLQEFEYFFNNNNDLCGIANDKGYFEVVNQNLCKVLGYSKKEILETPFVELIHADDIPATTEAYNELKSGAKVINFVNRYRKKDNSYIYLEWNASPNPATGKLYCIARDITKQLDDQKKLVEANKDLEAFSYSAAHDLRAPLRSIFGYADMLNEDYGKDLNDEAKRFIGTIQTNASKMNTLIDDLLAFSKFGNEQVKHTAIEMKELVNEIVNELKETTKAKCEVTLKDLLPIFGDRSLMSQVLKNLLSNAFKYSSLKEKPTVQISSKELNNEVIYTIKDNGAGFDMQHASKLFNVFQRLHSEKEFQGTGVGLALVHRIITNHNGKIWAEGEVGKGATFFFSLPKN